MIACTTTVALPSSWIVTPGSPNSEWERTSSGSIVSMWLGGTTAWLNVVIPINRDDHDRAPHPDFLVEVDVHHGLTE
jgi:hypothetical protein